MSPRADRLAASIEAFRNATASDVATDPTRARVVAALARRANRRAPRGLVLFLVAAPALAVFAGRAAWTAVGRYRSPGAVVIEVAEPEPPAATRASAHPLRVVPAAAAADAGPAAEPDDDGDESRAYARAHRAHFTDDSPGRALAAWDAYLRRHPRGALAPEARFNRAICLLRMGRLEEAAEALRPFAEGQLNGYRRPEARALLSWIDRKLSRRGQ